MSTALREAAQQALEALELHGKQYPHMVKGYCLDAITALRAALAQQQEQEPVAWRHKGAGHFTVTPLVSKFPEWEPLYTHPPRREWCSLSEEEIIDAVRESDLDWQKGWTLEDSEPNRYTQLARAIEQELKEKNA